MCTFLPFALKMALSAITAFWSVFKTSVGWAFSEITKAFCPVKVLLPINRIWEQKFLNTILRTDDLMHWSRSPKESNWFKSTN